MRLNVYPHSAEGLWIPSGQLARALKEGRADLCYYGVDFSWATGEFDAIAMRYSAMEKAFRRLVWHNGLRIKRALAREMKWLGISALFCWLPIRHWLEPRISRKGYLGLVGLLTVLIVGALAEVGFCFYKKRSLRKRFDNFKIGVVRHFPSRPKSPVNRTVVKENGPNLKYWATFLIISLICASIIPISSTWVVVHPLGGQDYATAGPTLIRPFSSWYIVPKTCESTVWTYLWLKGNKVWVFEFVVEWQVEDPLTYDPERWQSILDSALKYYFIGQTDAMLAALSVQYPQMTRDEHWRMIIEYISLWTPEIRQVLKEQLGAPMPFKILKARVRTVSIQEYSLYYQKLRRN